MSFTTDWLDLREAADNAARDADLRNRVTAFLGSTPDPLVVDLGAGTGSTMRALNVANTKWRLVDHDPALLAEAARRGGSMVETAEMDLTRVEAIPLDGASLVTASALFDLVGAEWIDALADRLAKARIGIYAALTYDGVLEWDPADDDDTAARAAFNADQRTVKGFGPALGPDGGTYLAEALRMRGFEVAVAQSPWRLGEADTALHASLLEGIAEAAERSGMENADTWLARRLEVVQQSQCTVGHVDVLALPA